MEYGPVCGDLTRRLKVDDLLRGTKGSQLSIVSPEGALGPFVGTATFPAAAFHPLLPEAGFSALPRLAGKGLFLETRTA